MRWIKRYYIEIAFFLIFVAIRIPGLGDDVFNTDVWKWKARTYDFGTGVFTLDFEKTIQKYHPGVILMWLGSAGVKVYNLYSGIAPNSSLGEGLNLVFGLHFVQKLFVTITIGLALAISLNVLKKLFSIRYAVLAMALIALDPFYTSLTRTFHLEGLMSSFMLASFLFFYSYLQNPKTKKLIWSGVFAGLAMLTKISAVYMIPFFGLGLLTDFIAKGKKDLKSYSSGFFILLGISIATFFLLWPAMWVYPLRALGELYRGVFTIGVERDHEQLYFGNLVGDPGFSFYFVVLALKSSIYLLPGLVGYLFIRRKINSDEKKFILYVFLFALFYFIQLSIPSKKLDRYLLPSIVSLSLISSFFYYHLIERLNNASWGHYALIVIPAALTLIRLHPNYLAYYNPYFGGLKKGINIIEPKWMFAQKEVVNVLRTMDPPYVFSDFELDPSTLSERAALERRIVGFPEKYYTQIWPFVRECGMIPIIEDLTPHAMKASFFVYPAWDDTSSLENRFDLEYEKSVYYDNVEVYKIYKKNN